MVLLPNGYFYVCIKDIDSADYYVDITSVQQYLVLLFFQAHRRRFFLAALASGQSHSTIMTNGM